MGIEGGDAKRGDQTKERRAGKKKKGEVRGTIMRKKGGRRGGRKRKRGGAEGQMHVAKYRER